MLCLLYSGCSQQSYSLQVEEVPPFSSGTNQVLDEIVLHFGLEGALEVKKVNRPTSKPGVM